MKALIFSLIAISLLSCNDDDETQKSYPPCLQTEIERVLNSPPQSPRATIELYSYQEENVYVVNTNFPDDQSNVYNSRCEVICSIGGIDGNENDTCVDWESADFIKTVWTDNR